jgi:type I restriction enzyme S subunit
MRCACHFITKGTTAGSEKLRPTGEIPFLKVYNIVNNRLDFDYKPTFISKDTHDNELTRSKVYPGDVLMNIVGPPLGKVAIVPNQYPPWNINQALAIFRPLSLFDSRFLMIVLSSSITIEAVLKETRGVVGQDNLSLEQVRNLKIPLIPISHQREIVAKVAELMSVCEGLETRLGSEQGQREQLLGSVLHHALQQSRPQAV